MRNSTRFYREIEHTPGGKDENQAAECKTDTSNVWEKPGTRDCLEEGERSRKILKE